MKKNYTTKPALCDKKRHLKNFFSRIHAVILLAFLLSPFISHGQTIIFTESMGTATSTTSIAAHEAANGYDNDNFTMTQGTVTNAADMRNTSASSGYTGSSGLANVFFTASGDRGFAIEGIDASSYSSLTVQFGYRKESATLLPSLSLDYWDGSAYANVPFTFNEAATAGVAWYLSPVISLPAGAQISTLKIRWVKSGANSVRIDDIVFKGTVASTPTLYATPNALTGFTYIEGGGPSVSQSYSLSGYNLTGFPDNILVTGTAHYEVSADDITFSNSFNVPYTSATLTSTPIYVRLISGLTIGNYNSETVSNAGGGAATLNVTCSGYVLGTAATYSWTGATDNDYQVGSNWNPARTSPAINDILQFHNGGTYTITNVPTQTIAKISVTSGTKITFQASGTVIFTIAGGTGDDLIVSGIGSELNVSGTNTISITLSTGATGLVSGSMIFSGAGHRLQGTETNAIIFQSGSIFNASTGFTGNAFGTTNLNTIAFQSGSTYIQGAGNNPFGASAPLSVVVFQTGSLFKFIINAPPSMSGRTYANFEIDAPTFSISVTGGTASSIDNLTITNGTFNYNMTGTSGHSIKGNIYVSTGATLNFAPGSAGTVNLNASAAQTISGTGTISSSGTLSTININNASGISLTTAATFNNLTVTTGTFTIASGASLITNGSSTVSTSASLINSGTYTLASGASLINTGTVTGSVIAERAISAWTNNLNGWHLLSSPVASQTIAPAFTDGTPGNYDFYKWDEPTNFWLNQKDIANSITTFIPGTGYLVAYFASSTKQFNGTLNNADLPVTGLTNSTGVNHGWNLLGNPFPSALTWGTANWALTNVTATAKIWQESSASYVDIPSTTGIIPAMNGFMVETSGSGSLVIPKADRVHSTTPWYKDGEVYIKLVARDPENSTAQETNIKVNANATEGFDWEFDSHFLAGYAPMFYSIIGDEYLSTNSLPNLDNGRVIEMGFVKNTATDFSIGLNPENMIPGLVVYLTDKKTGAVTELKQDIEYAFTSSEGDDASRFLLHFGPLGIDDPSANENYSVYSSAGNIYITSQQAGNADVRVSNLLGQVVMRSQTNGNSLTTLNANTLQNGIYVVSVIEGSKITTQKVPISR